MRIDRLVLKNYRCFENLEINFQNYLGDQLVNLHVLLAPNMTGKSAVLKALRIVLGARLQKIKVNAAPSKSLNINTNEHRVIGSNPFSDKAREVIIEASCSSQKWHNGWSQAHYVLKKYKEDYVETHTKIEHIEGNIVADANSAFNRVIEKKDGVLPILLYVGTEYIHQQKAVTETLDQDGSAKQGYWYCLDDKSMEAYVFEWFKKLHKTQLEQQRSPVAQELYQSIAETTLTTFKNAIKVILPEIIDVDWVEDTTSKKTSSYFLVFNIKNQGVRTYEMLSDGYKYLVLLIGELVTRATLLNKHLDKSVLNIVNGVVLIDEFGIHLHPNLQSDALTRLSKLFPNIQFIVTTHSPLLINGLVKEQIYIISEDREGKRYVRHPEDDAIGLGAEGILREMFNMDTTFDEQSIDQNEEYKKLLEKKEVANLNSDEEQRFKELGIHLSRFRLDPTLDIGTENPIAKIVKERLDVHEKSMLKRSSFSSDDADDLGRKVNSILDDLFKSE